MYLATCQEMMTDKAEESAFGPENQMKRHGEPMTLAPSKRRPTMALLSLKPEEEGASQAGGSAVFLEEDDPKVTAISVLGEVPDKIPIPMEINIEIRDQLKREIRQFGRKYGRIFKLLQEVQGPPKVQKKFVLYAMKEAASYKKQDLISHLKNILEKLESDHLNEDNPKPNL
ncbi:integrator complex subunit 6-like [Neofelis nebulosa]|uniref:integrator complex subunit 6-like n=1 Tax=Neofelis nebulosa TaxID=61452 RepID=UPI00272B8A99|nr:integrator complex subunit 6-like [Neofelis nebulosa]